MQRRVALGEVDDLGPIRCDRRHRDDDVGLAGIHIGDAGCAGGRDEFGLGPVLGEQLGHFDIGAGGLHGGVHHAGRRNREVGR